MIVLGVLFWTGNALNLIGLHMLLGITLVLLLWALAIMARAVRNPRIGRAGHDLGADRCGAWNDAEPAAAGRRPLGDQVLHLLVA